MDLRNRRHTPGWYLKSKGLYSFGFHACMVPLIVVNFRCKEVIPNIPSIYRIMWFIILNNKIKYIYIITYCWLCWITLEYFEPRGYLDFGRKSVELISIYGNIHSVLSSMLYIAISAHFHHDLHPMLFWICTSFNFSNLYNFCCTS